MCECLKYLLHLRHFVAEEFHDDGTLVLKHTEIGTCYEVYFAIYFIVF
jgi:hypothetical protein